MNRQRGTGKGCTPAGILGRRHAFDKTGEFCVWCGATWQEWLDYDESIEEID